MKNKAGFTWVRPGHRRDGEAHAFEESNLEDGSIIVNNVALCGRQFKSMGISRARAYGNISSAKCPKCEVRTK